MRYRSASAFADDVERYLAGKPVRAHPQSRRYRLEKFVRRHRVGIAIGATFALAMLLGAGGVTWQAQIAAHERDMARAERDAAQLESRFNGALYEFLVGLFRDGVRDEEKLNPREFLARGVTWINAHAPDDVGSRALVFTVLGELQILREDPTGARALLQPLVEENPAGLPANLAARLRCTLAQAEEADGKLERAKALAEEGIVLARDLTGSARATLLECRSVVGTVLADLNQDAAALEMLRLAISEAPLDSNDPGVLNQRAAIEHAYAVGLFYTGRIAEAIAHGESALAIYERIKRTGSNQAIATLGNLAMAHLSAGQPLAADARFEQVIALSEQYGRSTGFAQRLINAAATKVVLEQPADALALLDRAEAMYSALSANAPRARAQASLERGKALSLRGDYVAAERAFVDADKAIDAGYPPQHFWRGYTSEQRARAAFSRGDYAAAETQLARAVEHYGADNGSGRRAFVRAQIFGAELALARSDAVKALGILNEIEPIAASVLEPDDWQRAWLQTLRGRSLVLLGRQAEAQTLLAPTPERLARALGREHSLTRRAVAWANDAMPSSRSEVP
ncbi:tetratricopeptide repeat protein [Pseudolysobacter antarcticus]|uniref:tetratricopeptide repeat protein n=1 Tax=Pseudolysobacter antarcticus TaxID=2511995 RepID=UPI001F5E21CB|nr:tetratricopeptide repeat protein [Pseudolysobacter antarcticus]